MTRWYVVHTQARAETRAVWHLENQGFKCFLPRIRMVRRHARKVTPAIVPLFPRYLFVRFEADIAWRAINGTRGVIRLLTNGKFPLPVPFGVIEALLDKCDPQSIVPLVAMGVFTRGLKVRIKSGAFSGQTAQINEIFAEGSDRVHVLLTLLGAKADLELPSYAIEAA